MRYAAAIAAALTAAQTALPLSPAQHGWVTVALAAVGAIAVWAVPNDPPPAAPLQRAPSQRR